MPRADLLSEAAIVAGIADALPVGVWVARAPGGEFVYANQTFREIMGMGARPDVALGEYAAPYAIHDREGALYPEDRMPFVRALVERDVVMVDDIVIHRADGGRVNVRAYARPIFGDDEVISHVVIAFFDITREVAAERARVDSDLRMRRARRMDSIGMLAGGIAHDFNNLLGAILAMTSVLRTEEDDLERQGDLDTIAAAADSGVLLTRALLGLAGRGKNLAAPVALEQTVRSVVEIFGRATTGRLELVTDLRARQHVEGDHAQLEQVVMNLLINARDAIVDRGKVTVRTYDDGDRVVLEVEDDGPGVPAELRERVFEPYFTTKDGEIKGSTGLGLATVYGVVEAHGGTVDVHDAPGGGALFRVVLAAGAGDRPAPQPQRDNRTVTRGSGLVLVVDDQSSIRVAAQRGLELAGYHVVTATDGREGVEVFRARASEIDAVLLDMNMPNLDGRGAFEALRQIDPQVRILLMTGYALNEQAQSLLDRGRAGFIAKPFDLAGLSAAMATLLGA